MRVATFHKEETRGLVEDGRSSENTFEKWLIKGGSSLREKKREKKRKVDVTKNMWKLRRKLLERCEWIFVTVFERRRRRDLKSIPQISINSVYKLCHGFWQKQGERRWNKAVHYIIKWFPQQMCFRRYRVSILEMTMGSCCTENRSSVGFLCILPRSVTSM